MGKVLKYSWPIIPAVIIDALQFLLTLGISVIAATPATSAGGLAGCLVGKHFLGEIGCAVGGFALAVLGTSANIFVAPFTIPLGIALSFAITICISATFGALLMVFIWVNGNFSLKAAIWLIAEITPGVSVVPVWTIFAIRCAYIKIHEEAGLRSSNSFGKVAFAGVNTFGGMMQKGAGLMAPKGIEGSQPQKNLLTRFTPYNPQEHAAAMAQEKELAEQYRSAPQARTILNDIRSSKAPRNNRGELYA